MREQVIAVQNFFLNVFSLLWFLEELALLKNGYLHKYAPKLIQNLLFGGGGSSKEWMYSLFVFGQVPKNKYIQYSYSVRLPDTNIFDIRIRLAV